MKVMIDNDISPHIAAAIHALVEPRGSSVVALRKKFKANTAVVDWIKALGQEGGWSVISNNIRITKVAVERHAWRQTDLVGYFSPRAGARSIPWSKPHGYCCGGRSLRLNRH